jgi:hypothetical protein
MRQDELDVWILALFTSYDKVGGSFIGLVGNLSGQNMQEIRNTLVKATMDHYLNDRYA